MILEQLKQKRDKRVRKSSHGVFASVADLEQHRVEVSRVAKLAVREHFSVRDNWTTTDRGTDAYTSEYLSRSLAQQGGAPLLY